jgi:hypothetical protein
VQTQTMGRVLTEAIIENLEDLWAARRGTMAPEQVRRITVANALVDTGATLVSLPSRVIRELGIHKTDRKRVTASSGLIEADLYDAVRLTILLQLPALW